MKSVFTILALAASALAQSVDISFPTPGQNISAGSSINVQVSEGRQLQAVTEIGVAVTLQHCQQNPCEDVSDDLGTIFFAGPYQPQNFMPPSVSGEPYQNFTVNIPSNFTKGPAVFSVPHAALFSLGPQFFTQIANVTVNIS